LCAISSLSQADVALLLGRILQSELGVFLVLNFVASAVAMLALLTKVSMDGTCELVGL